MKKISLLVLICMIAALVLGTLTACGDGEGAHTHAYGDKWIMENDKHYHMCACGAKADSAIHADSDGDEACDACGIKMDHTVHSYGDTLAFDADDHFKVCDECGAKTASVPHADENGDEACDACGIKMDHTTHSYGTAWAFDAAGHFHVCDECGARDAATAAAHADENNDGACDTCAIVIENRHAYSDEWTSDADNHWHVPVCGHDVEVADKAAHEADLAGKCAVCGYRVFEPDVSTFDKALEIATFTQSAVKSGEFANMTIYSWGGSNVASSIKFEYGDGFLYTYDEMADISTYVTEMDDGSAYFVQVNHYDPTNPYVITPNADPAYLDGACIDINNTVIAEDVYIYGAVALIEFFAVEYPAALDKTPVIEMIDGAYTATYTVPAADQYDTDKNVTVAFTLDEDDYIIDELAIAIENEGDIQLLSYIQQINAKNDYTPDEVIPTEYVIKNADGEVITFTDNTADVIDAYFADYNISIEVVSPVTGLIAALGEVDITVLDAAGEESNRAFASYDKAANIVSVSFYAIGEYYLNLSVGADSFVIPFNITYATPTEIYPQLGYKNYYDETEYADAPETVTKYVGQSVSLAALLPTGCLENQYTAALTQSEGAELTDLGIVYDGMGNEIQSYEFNSTAAGTYTVVFTSTVDPEVTATVTIEVANPPALSTLTVGKWAFSQSGVMQSVDVTVNFYPTNDTKGVIVIDELISSAYGDQISNGIYTYYIKDEVLYTTFVSATFQFGENPPEDNPYFEYNEIYIDESYAVVYYSESISQAFTLEQAASEPDPYAGTLPEAPDAPVDTPPTPIAGGIGNLGSPAGEIVRDTDGEIKYITTVPAGETYLYNIYMDASDVLWFLSVSVEGNVSAVLKNSMSEEVGFSGLPFNYDSDYLYTLALTNSGAEDEEVIFSVNPAEAESISGGTNWADIPLLTIEATGTYVYKTTVGAGETLKYKFMNPAESERENDWTISIVIDGEVTATLVNIVEENAPSLEDNIFDYDYYVYTLGLANEGAADAEVYIYVTVADAPIA